MTKKATSSSHKERKKSDLYKAITALAFFDKGIRKAKKSIK